MSLEPNHDDTPASANPYQSPRFAAAATVVAPKELRRLVWTYRSQLYFLGSLWILMGIIALADVALYFSLEPAPADRLVWPVVVFAGLGTAWLLLGVATCCRRIAAVYIGLATTYLALILLLVNPCLPITLLAAIVQAHLVLRSARQIQQQGLPLSIRAQDIPFNQFAGM